MAAYAQMAGVSNSWTLTDAGVPGHPIHLVTLAGSTNISLVFMRLPDGGMSGRGFKGRKQSLQRLWEGSMETLPAIDGSTLYTEAELIAVLTTLMERFQPSQVRTLNYVGSFNDGDHSDHHAVAYFAYEAHLAYQTPHTFTGYMGYQTSSLPPNVTGQDLIDKQDAFFAYARFDSHVCQSLSSCARSSVGAWLQRQYTVP